MPHAKAHMNFINKSIDEIGTKLFLHSRQHDAHIKRIAKRRGKKKAIVAIARMMLANIYHMLSDNENFHPDDYEATVNPPKQKPVVLTLDNTLQFLREQGADPETLKLIQRQCAVRAR